MSKRHFTFVTIGSFFFFFSFLGTYKALIGAAASSSPEAQAQTLSVVQALCSLLGRKLAPKLCHWNNEKEKLLETGGILDTFRLRPLHDLPFFICGFSLDSPRKCGLCSCVTYDVYSILMLFFLLLLLVISNKLKSSDAKLKESFGFVNFIKISVRRKKIQISVPIEEQVLIYMFLGSRLFASWHRSAGHLISQHTAQELAVAWAATCEWRHPRHYWGERSYCGLRMEIKGLVAKG